MAYENYKTIKSEEEYFSNWQQDQLSELSEDDKKVIYNRYFVKCMVFQRDKFSCQNELCTGDSPTLEMHHIKHRRNGGKDSVKNCVTLCRSCHKSFHRAKTPLRIWGATYQDDKLVNPQKHINWKKVRIENKQLRKGIKYESPDLIGCRISGDLIRKLIKFLNINYLDLIDEEDE